jgi:hypothetical protein
VGNAKNGGIDGVKNRSGKCEGPEGLGGGLDELNNWSGKCEGPRGGGGVDGVKNRSEKCKGLREGGTNGCLKR